MKCKFLLVVVILFSSSLAWAQQDSLPNRTLDKALVPSYLITARAKFNVGNVRGGLEDYRMVLDVDASNATALYGSAEGYYRLKRYKTALSYLEKSCEAKGEISNEALLFFAQCHHRLANLDKAIEFYTQYMEKLDPLAIDYDETEHNIQECLFAKYMMSVPADVKISNMGKQINSRYEEYSPSITSDGKLLYFTSRRANTTGGEIDRKGDFKFYEDVFYAVKTDTGWSSATQVEGMINSETHDGVLSISSDGTLMYIYKNDGKSFGDIWTSKKGDDGRFTPPMRMSRPINSDRFESSTSMSADGKYLFFVSEREEGLGHGDIYMATNNNGIWTAPKNLGATINTAEDEKFVFIHPNGKSLFFASNGHLTMGSYDIFKSEWVNGEWTPPVNLGYPINTVNEESTMTITADNSIMYMAAEYDNSLGERDIYAVDCTKYPLMSLSRKQEVYTEMVVVVKDNRGKLARGMNVRVMDERGIEVVRGVTNKSGVFKAKVVTGHPYTVQARHGNKTATKLSQPILIENAEELRTFTVQFQ